ncbi:MAG: hypothetical protein AAB767_03710 [Patescibacteria group bacterium]
MNYETRDCHCEHFAVALHRLREAIQKQGVQPGLLRASPSQ